MYSGEVIGPKKKRYRFISQSSQSELSLSAPRTPEPCPGGAVTPFEVPEVHWPPLPSETPLLDSRDSAGRGAPSLQPGSLPSSPSLMDTPKQSQSPLPHSSLPDSPTHREPELTDCFDSPVCNPNESKTTVLSPPLSPSFPRTLLSSPEVSPTAPPSVPGHKVHSVSAVENPLLSALYTNWEPETVNEYSDSDEGDAPVSEMGEGDVVDMGDGRGEAEVDDVLRWLDDGEEPLVPEEGGGPPGEREGEDTVSDTQHLEIVREIEETVQLIPSEKPRHYKTTSLPISLPYSSILSIPRIKNDETTLSWWVEKFKVCIS